MRDQSPRRSTHPEPSPRAADLIDDLFLLPNLGIYWVVPTQANRVFELGKSSGSVRNTFARYCPRLRKADNQERALLIQNGLLGKKAPNTNLVPLIELIAYLDRIGKTVPDFLRRLSNRIATEPGTTKAAKAAEPKTLSCIKLAADWYLGNQSAEPPLFAGQNAQARKDCLERIEAIQFCRDPAFNIRGTVILVMVCLGIADPKAIIRCGPMENSPAKITFHDQILTIGHLCCSSADASVENDNVEQFVEDLMIFGVVWSFDPNE